MAGGVMVFRREGILRRRIVIETLREEPIARISLLPLAASGELRHTDGNQYRFTTRGGFEWSDASGRVLAGDALPLVLVFAEWYLHVTLRHEQDPAPKTAASGLPSLQTGLSFPGTGSSARR
jgi:hypothetical protein